MKEGVWCAAACMCCHVGGTAHDLAIVRVSHRVGGSIVPSSMIRSCLLNGNVPEYPACPWVKITWCFSRGSRFILQAAPPGQALLVRPVRSSVRDA